MLNARIVQHFSKTIQAPFPSFITASVSEGQSPNSRTSISGLEIRNQMRDLSWLFVLGGALRCPGRSGSHGPRGSSGWELRGQCFEVSLNRMSRLQWH